MLRTRIKICGLTRVEDAMVAAKAGADAIGLVFHPPSPRCVSIGHALAICNAMPPFVSTVALFVNAPPETVLATIKALRPSMLQFHGDELEPYCAQFGMPYLKAIRIDGRMQPDDLLECETQFRSARALLLDTLTPNLYGGSGERFDWELIPPSMRGRIVLSGGLNPLNVGQAIENIRPWAVDVSSGVELDKKVDKTVDKKVDDKADKKGIKDHRKIEQFIEAVQNANV